jgi:hypothetical protein
MTQIGLHIGVGRNLRRNAAALAPPALPVQAANLWGAWRPADAVSDADGIVSLAGAYGTTRQALGGAAAAKPDALAGLGPNGTTVMRFDKARLEHLSIPAFSTNQSFTLVCAYSPGSQASVDGVILGQAASSTHRIRVASVGTSVQARIGGPTEVTVPFAAGAVVPNEMAIVAFVYDAVAQTGTAYLNGVAGTATALANGVTTLDVIGRTGTAYALSQLGEVLLYTIALTPAEVASATAFLSAFRSQSYFVAANGSDTNPGWSSAAPMLNAAAAIARPIRPGGSIRLRGGDTFGGLGTITLAGQSGAPITIGSYGTGRARIWGNSPITSGWTDAGGGLWTRSTATAPLVVLHCPNGAAHVPTQPSDFRRLANQATSNDWSFQWATGVLTIRTDGVLSPNGAEFVVIESGAIGVTVQSTAPWVTLEGLDIRYHGGFGVRPFGPNGVARDCHAIGNANDGFAPSVAGAWSILGTDNLAAFNGTGISGAGDGASWHGASTGACENLVTIANAVGGIRNEGGSNVTVTGGSDRGNAIDVTMLNQGGTGGALSLTGRTIRVTAASGSGRAAELASGAGVTLTVTGCTFIREAGSQPNAIAANGNTVVDGGGNTLVGFTSLT